MSTFPSDFHTFVWCKDLPKNLVCGAKIPISDIYIWFSIQKVCWDFRGLFEIVRKNKVPTQLVLNKSLNNVKQIGTSPSAFTKPRSNEEYVRSQ